MEQIETLVRKIKREGRLKKIKAAAGSSRQLGESKGGGMGGNNVAMWLTLSHSSGLGPECLLHMLNWCISSLSNSCCWVRAKD